MSTATAVRSAPQAARASRTPGRSRPESPRRPATPEVLDIVHITAECAPFARTGGLGEAVAGLAASQAAAGARVTIIMPMYRSIRQSVADLRPVGPSITIVTNHGQTTVQLHQRPALPGSPRVIFVDHGASFDRDGIYGWEGRDYDDNGQRFRLLSAAAIQSLPHVAPHARVVHAHDWHAAPALAYLRDRRRSSRDQVLRVLSVHNAAFQGQFPLDTISDAGDSPATDSLSAFEWYGQANFLKAGLTCADLTFTVSPNHAGELRTPAGGFGLHDNFAALGDRLIGVLNGIDVTEWDPSTDRFIPSCYSRGRLAGKAECKSALQRECGLQEIRTAPLFGMCTRLAEQKGLDLLLAADLLRETNAQFIVVGQGERRYEEALTRLAAAAPHRFAVRLDFSDALEHRMIAGVDALLMPSLFEPCGLTQMRAQRYGTIPVVRKVGGLVDTVVDEVTGFMFDAYTPGAFLAGIRLAANRHAQKGLWREMMRRAMLRDFGWTHTADEYCSRYRGALVECR